MTAIDDARAFLEELPEGPFTVKRIEFQGILGPDWLHDAEGDPFAMPMQWDCQLLNLLPALIHEAEKWQQIAISERAQRRLVAKYMLIWRDGHRKDEEEIAAHELRAEAGSWKHIGPEERAAIRLIVNVVDSQPRPGEVDVPHAADMLRRMLEGLP